MSSSWILLLSAIFVFSGYLHAAEATASNTTIEFQTSIEKSLTEKDYAQAEQICNRVIAANTDSAAVVSAQKELAIIYIRQNNLMSADGQIELLKTQFESNVNTPEALFLIAKELDASGQCEKSLDLHRYNSEHYPETHFSMISQVKIVNADLLNKQYRAAQAGMNTLLLRFAKQPGLPLEVYKFGRKFSDAGQLEQARLLFQYNVEHPTSDEYAMKSRIALFEMDAVEGKDNIWISTELDKIKSEYSSQAGLPQEFYLIAEVCREEAHAGAAFQIDQYNAEQFAGTEYGMKSHTECISYQINKKDYDQANASSSIFSERYNENPGFVKQVINIIGEYEKRQALSKAEPLCKFALQRQPTNKDAIVLKKYLVLIQLENGDLEDAKTGWNELKAAYRSSSGYFRQAHETAFGFYKKGQYSVALPIYDELLSQFPKHEEIGRIVCYKAMAYLGSGDLEKSVQSTEDAFTKYINWKPMPRKLLEIGCLYNLAGHKEQAQQVLTRVLNEHSGQLIGSDAAIAYVHLGDEAKVQEQIQQALGSGRTLTLKHQFLMEVAQEYEKMAQLAQTERREDAVKEAYQKEIAVSSLVIASTETRHSADAFYCCGCAYQKCDEYQKAIDAYRTLVDRWPRYERAWYAQYRMAQCYDSLLQQNQTSIEEVKACYQKLLEKYPNCAASKIAEKKVQSL